MNSKRRANQRVSGWVQARWTKALLGWPEFDKYCPKCTFIERKNTVDLTKGSQVLGYTPVGIGTGTETSRTSTRKFTVRKGHTRIRTIDKTRMNKCANWHNCNAISVHSTSGSGRLIECENDGTLFPKQMLTTLETLTSAPDQSLTEGNATTVMDRSDAVESVLKKRSQRSNFCISASRGR